MVRFKVKFEQRGSSRVAMFFYSTLNDGQSWTFHGHLNMPPEQFDVFAAIAPFEVAEMKIGRTDGRRV